MTTLEINSTAKPKKIKSYILLHLSFLIYASGTVLMKFASGHAMLSSHFLLFYMLALVALGLYAILWQQVLKALPLTIAFSNKAVTILWGMLTGYIIFKETITPKMLIGAVIIVIGITFVANGETDA